MEAGGLTTTAESDFELDVTFAENGPVIGELMNSTSDNCGSTSQSACTTCLSGRDLRARGVSRPASPPARRRGFHLASWSGTCGR
jgi:FxLD family lantipeptide